MSHVRAWRSPTHPVKLGFEAVQGGEDTQADAPRISKNETTPFRLSPQYVRARAANLAPIQPDAADDITKAHRSAVKGKSTPT